MQQYKIVKLKCADLVLDSTYQVDVYMHDKRIGSTFTGSDSCIFHMQTDESFFTFNICHHAIQETKPHKVPLDVTSIDSITIESNALKQVRSLTTRQIKKFVRDWNSSRPRGYADMPFDSAFTHYLPYQYRLTVFSKGDRRPFYGDNYLILDSSNWKFIMDQAEDLSYFQNYWGK